MKILNSDVAYILYSMPSASSHNGARAARSRVENYILLGLKGPILFSKVQ